MDVSEKFFCLAGLAPQPVGDASVDVCTLTDTTAENLRHDGENLAVSCPIACNADVDELCRPGLSTHRKRGSLKELLQVRTLLPECLHRVTAPRMVLLVQGNISCPQNCGRYAGSMQKHTSCSNSGGATSQGDEEHPVTVKNLPKTKSVADLKRCKYALPKAMPFKKPRRELRRL